jgi:hypothetical protein
MLIRTTPLAVIVMMGGCSMMPYEENFSCNKNIGIGTCTSVSENYYISKRFKKESVYERYQKTFGEGDIEKETRQVVILKDGTSLESEF